MLSIEQLTQEVLSLPRESRELLAEKLVESLELDINPAIQAVWNAEARKRLDEIRSVAVQGIPGEEALSYIYRTHLTSPSKQLDA